MSSEQAQSAIGGRSIAPLTNGQHPTQVGKYRLDGIVGEGAFGLVYKGYDEQLDRPVAIKTLKAKAIADVPDRDVQLKRFEVEARSAGRCFHTNIVTVFDYVEQDGAPFLVMEYVDAGTLEDVVSSGTMLPIGQVGDVGEQLLLALDHAHSKGVVHRDIKPANILCPADTSIKVADFGIARFGTLGITTASGDGTLGTPNYMAPEQFLGRPIDGRADLFAAGVILFQLIAGAKPFVAGNVAELMHRLLNESAPSLSTLRPGNWQSLDSVVQRALARNPDDRFQTAQEFAHHLRGAIELTDKDNAAPLDLSKISMASLEAKATEEPNDQEALSQTMSAKLMPTTLGAIEKSLAKSIGPIARIVIRKISNEATDADAMLSALSDKIPVKTEADIFRQEAADSIRSDNGVAAVQLESIISAADVEMAGDALVVVIGPVARILARRLAQTEIGRDNYFRRLSESIPDERHRSKFLSQMNAL